MKIFDSWDSQYKKPFGSISTGETCNFTIRLGENITPDTPPVLILFRTGFKERFVIMSRSENLPAAGFTEYSCAYTAQFSGVCYYYFSYTINQQRYFIKKIGASEGGIDEQGGLFQLTVCDRDFATPEFIKGGVMYQIFPDRFRKSGAVHENVPDDRILREDWGGTPNYLPDETGHVWNNDYFGGDLLGIAEKIPYLSDLGVTCIYLNPIFEAHENHRYNTANYMKIDPLLGTNEDFRSLCDSAYEYGISIIIDGVFSHTGADSIYFNKFHRYDTEGAFNSEKSEFYPWYTFFEYPDKYEAWWGIDTLPNVRENNEEYTDYICGKNGVLQYWLDMGASGWRLDVADELPDVFLDNLRKSVKSFDAEKLIIGEVWEDASNKESYGVKRRYLIGSQLDSVMNYPFRNAIHSYIRGGSADAFRTEVLTILENYPKPAVDVLMNFISTHDVERAINVFGGDDCGAMPKDEQAVYRLSPTQYAKGKKLLKLAMVLQFFLPGVPCIYYGDEAGLEGCRDPFNRRCFPWGSEDTEIIDFVKLLSSIRRMSKVFKTGTLHFIYSDESIMTFARLVNHRRKAAIIFLNRSDEVQYIDRTLKMSDKYRRFFMLYGEMSDDRIIVPPMGFAVLKAEM